MDNSKERIFKADHCKLAEIPVFIAYRKGPGGLQCYTYISGKFSVLWLVMCSVKEPKTSRPNL